MSSINSNVLQASCPVPQPTNPDNTDSRAHMMADDDGMPVRDTHGTHDYPTSLDRPGICPLRDASAVANGLQGFGG